MAIGSLYLGPKDSVEKVTRICGMSFHVIMLKVVYREKRFGA